jgi:flagellar hook-associated protein 2
MSTRISGLISGLDTESIISQLVEAKQTKIDTQTKAQTKLSWKQDAWKELNTKLKNLQQKYISNMRFSSSYAKMTTSVSNSSAVSVITGDNAVEGVQELEVNQLAKTGYLTGAKLSGSDGSSLTALSTLSDLGYSGSGSFSVTTGNTTVDINVTGDTTISDVLTQLKNAGLNANFDEKQQRLFVSSKKSGADNDFNITASDADGLNALSALGLNVKVEAPTADSEGSASYKAYQQYAQYAGADDAATLANLRAAGVMDSTVTSKTDSYLDRYKTLLTSVDASQKKIDDINEKYKDTTLKSVSEYETELTAANEKVTSLQEQIDAETDEDAKAELQTQLEEAQANVTDLETKKADAQTLVDEKANIEKYNDELDEIAGADGYITVTKSEDADGNVTYTADATNKLIGEVEDSFVSKVNTAKSVIDGTANLSGNYATKVNGQDAKITLNGAEFTSNDNVFEINGLTFTALSQTKEGESVTVTTSQDTDGIYDMVKNFLTEYNSIINEMDKLYNADSASGYEPLTDEEKSAMSDSEVEKYETKIKDALLRRDDNLNTVSSALKTVMSSGIQVNGKTMYLSDFGIATLGYFTAADNEKNAYHIDGDEDDSDTSGNTDKLKSMIASDSSTVISFFTQLSQNLYTKMSDLSKSVDGYRSYGSFYDDKKMSSDYSDYTTKISEMEDKLNDYEDKLYSKYSSMETALAKLQSNSSAVTALLGG